ncbi:Clp protease N-terminal domain-containing protein [Zhihengliuella halotolerans]|uniref:ClpA/ClpB-like protein n=1 Tax=Zhihengliuella halotolerans TaxID=370736 RepID=A0A4Q8AAE2_9MICC|nr:Clp protease N-terminal domain-containing protein [Zhihengliuella halotolerans]RZU60934.1 ClpA/ClpB-like protein [Zhihengliuella halotolerans]
MNKLVRAAQTSQSLSLAAMEEASRLGLREADIDHLFLALVINDQSAGHALRELGIDIDSARLAVAEQHNQQLAALGIEASFPEAGQIVFHETDGYEWSPRARDLIAKSSGKGKAGDAAAVLRELVAEPSGLMTDILDRLGTTSDSLLKVLDESGSPAGTTTAAMKKVKSRTAGSVETFVPAPIDDVWTLLADPTRIPEWESSIGVVDQTSQDPTPGTTWEGTAPTNYPNGKPAKIKPQFRRRSIELVTAHPPGTIAWSFGYPDAARSNPVVTEFALTSTIGGTQVQIIKSWARRRGWRRLLALPLRPIEKFLVWISLFQSGSAISRIFR